MDTYGLYKHMVIKHRYGLPSGYLTVRHRTSPFLMGKSPFLMLKNQRVPMIFYGYLGCLWVYPNLGYQRCCSGVTGTRHSNAWRVVLGPREAEKRRSGLAMAVYRDEP